MTDADLDLALVRRAQQGNQRAFERLVVKYQARVLHLVLRLVKDPDEAADVVQETFIRAYKALAAFRGESAFYTWLYRIAVNTAKNQLLGAQRRPVTESLESEEEGEQRDVPTRLRDYATPEQHLLKEQVMQTIRQTLDNLPLELRTALLLREIEEMSYDEIAQVMNCPVGTVRSRIFRAREAIDQQLAPLLEK